MIPGDSNPKQSPHSDKPVEPETISSSSFKGVPPSDFSTQSAKREEKESFLKNDFEKKRSEEASKTNGMEDALDYVRNNKESIITYLALVIGLIFLLLGDFFLGSLIIGLTAGYHFSYEIVFYLRNVSHIFEGHEHLRFLVLTAVIIGFFLSIPGIFIGAIVAAVFKHVIYDKRE